jgi:hypothetical protein
MHVANDRETVIARDVAKTEPEDFPQAFLDALNGDERFHADGA